MLAVRFIQAIIEWDVGLTVNRLTVPVLLQEEP
jgi:hypothetical protein